MANYIVAGVGVCQAYAKGSTPTLLFTSTTLQEQSMSLSISSEDIRGGMSNGLIGKYFHDSLLECTLTDALFNMNYIMLNAGGTIQSNTDSFTTESVTVGTGGTITVNETPVAFGDTSTIYGWYALEGSEDWNMITFSGQTATVAELTQGTAVCVRYNVNNAGMQYFNVPSKVIPSVIHLYMTYPLFSAGTSDDVSSKTQVGELIIDIPRFQLSGTFDMSLTSSGAATSNLSGSALAKSATSNCQDVSSYASIKMKLYDSVWYDDLKEMAIEDAEFTLAVSGTKTLKVYGIYKDGATGYIPNTLLTFASDNAAATVDNSTNKGKVTGASAGTAHIEVKPTAVGTGTAPAVAAYAEVTVQSA